MLYSDTDSVELLAPGTAGQVLQTNGVAAPTFVNKSISGKAQAVSAVTVEQLQVPNNQLTLTGTNTHLVETGNTNILINSSFEHSTYDTDWVSTGAATESQETTTVFDGDKSYEVAATAQSFAVSQSGESSLHHKRVSSLNKLSMLNIKHKFSSLATN